MHKKGKKKGKKKGRQKKKGDIEKRYNFYIPPHTIFFYIYKIYHNLFYSLRIHYAFLFILNLLILNHPNTNVPQFVNYHIIFDSLQKNIYSLKIY